MRRKLKFNLKYWQFCAFCICQDNFCENVKLWCSKILFGFWPGYHIIEFDMTNEKVTQQAVLLHKTMMGTVSCIMVACIKLIIEWPFSILTFTKPMFIYGVPRKSKASRILLEFMIVPRFVRNTNQKMR